MGDNRRKRNHNWLIVGVVGAQSACRLIFVFHAVRMPSGVGAAMMLASIAFKSGPIMGRLSGKPEKSSVLTEAAHAV
jgi:hypothetical protein